MAYNLLNEDYTCIRTNKFVPFQFRIALTKKFPQVTSKLFEVFTLKTFLLGRINVSLLDLQSINFFDPKAKTQPKTKQEMMFVFCHLKRIIIIEVLRKLIAFKREFFHKSDFD